MNEVVPLNIVSIRDLSFRLGVPRGNLVSVARRAGSFYRPFEKITAPPPFRKKAFSAKTRHIDNPFEPLKEIQKRINRRLLQPIFLPEHVFGGVKGRSVRQNAGRHSEASVVVTVDIKSFFPTIDNRNVYSVWRSVLGCGEEVSSLLTKLTTFERRLPQGAATSTFLANLFLLSIDRPIRDFCSENGICYTNWVDDLAFSGPAARDVISITVDALRSGGLSISRKKLKIMPAGNRQVLTGLVLNHKIGVNKEYRQATRSAIHKLSKKLVSPARLEKYIRSVSGRIAYIRLHNPGQASDLERQFHQALLLKSS